MRAVCLRCGNWKGNAPDRCLHCKFQPRSNIDLAKSFILSTQFDVGEHQFGRPEAELAAIANAISGGKPYEFSKSEVTTTKCEVIAFKAITPKVLFIAGVKWLAPPLFMLAILWVLIYVFKSG